MPESVAQSPEPVIRARHHKRKNSNTGGYTYRLLFIAILLCLAAGGLLVGVHKHLDGITQNLTVREVLVWLNPAFSEIPDEYLPFGKSSDSGTSQDPQARVSGAGHEAGGFLDKDNPFSQTAGHAATPGKVTSTSPFPLGPEPLPPLPQSENSAPILPEKPRSVDTTINPIIQAANTGTRDTQPIPSPGGVKEPEARQPVSQGTKIPAGKQHAEQQSNQEKQGAKNPSPVSSKEVPNAEKQTSVAPKKDTPDWEANTRSEKFQLPGSVLVKIQNYSGATVNWDLAVILDDSHSMGRQTKSWNPSRFQAALTFIEKLPSALNPGAKIAVRDFLCGSSKDKKDVTKGCSSRLLIDWTAASSKQWKELLEKADHGGSTDPCAAAALCIKRDFHGGTGRKPRLLVITGGAATPCASSHVVKAIDSSEATKGAVVDVLALGLGKKRQKGFVALAHRTGGFLMEIEKPADLDHSFARYAKVLQAKVFEKVEIKNDRASLSFNPHQEMSLAPGTYTVILPLVEGLESSRRVIPNVKISSAETSIIDVTIRKGRPTVRIGKKQ